MPASPPVITLADRPLRRRQAMGLPALLEELTTVHQHTVRALAVAYHAGDREATERFRHTARVLNDLYRDLSDLLTTNTTPQRDSAEVPDRDAP